MATTKRESLKSILNTEIRSAGYLSVQQVYDIARSMQNKVSNAERRLRPSESPNVRSIRSADSPHAIIGYEWDNTAPQKEGLLEETYFPGDRKSVV